MDTPTLRQLRTFVAVIEMGSITGAARSLHLTQPAASQQLRELERNLGAKLFDRAEGKLVPTAAATAIMTLAQRALTAATDITAVAETFRSGASGRVKLGTGATACIYLLPPILASAKRRMPGLEIVVATGNTPDIIRRVEEGELDLGFVTLPSSIGRSLVSEPLLQDLLVALVPNGTSKRPTLSPTQLAELSLILFESGGDTRGIIDSWFRKAGLTSKPVMELGSVEAIKVLVAGGLGASVLPGLSVAAGVPGAEVKALRPAISRRLGLVMRRDKVLVRGLRILLEELRGLAR